MPCASILQPYNKHDGPRRHPHIHTMLWLPQREPMLTVDMQWVMSLYLVMIKWHGAIMKYRSNFTRVCIILTTIMTRRHDTMPGRHSMLRDVSEQCASDSL